jgi:hypothetical protein
MKKLAYFVNSFGLDPIRLYKSTVSILPFLRNVVKIHRSRSRAWPLRIFPALGDRIETAGTARGHYFHMDLWAARSVHAGHFQTVIDVGSRVDGFVAHILSFREIECYDIRRMRSQVKGLSFVQADIMATESLPAAITDCLTSLHALEHFGLGRYGDPVDMDGWKKGIASFAKLLMPGGTLLLAVPTGRQRIEFDAHRVFDPQTIVDEAAENGLALESFCLVDDSGEFHENSLLDTARAQDYGCGCFQFRRQE